MRKTMLGVFEKNSQGQCKLEKGRVGMSEAEGVA